MKRTAARIASVLLWSLAAFAAWVFSISLHAGAYAPAAIAGLCAWLLVDFADEAWRLSRWL